MLKKRSGSLKHHKNRESFPDNMCGVRSATQRGCKLRTNGVDPAEPRNNTNKILSMKLHLYKNRKKPDVERRRGGST